MFTLTNHTAHQAGLYPGWSADGLFQYTLVIKVAWHYQVDGSLALLETAAPIIKTDHYYANPLTSSLQHATEIMPYKAVAEWLLTGSVNRCQASKQHAVNVTIRNQQQTLRKSVLIDFSCTDHHRLPLRYEYAKRSLKNPVGIARQQKAPLRSTVLKRDMSAFAAIAPFWPTRKKYSEQIVINSGVEQAAHGVAAPHLLHNVAPKEQQFRHYFLGSQQIALSGFTAHPIHLTIPDIQFQVNSSLKPTQQFVIHCDTLLINTDKQVVYKLWRAAIAADLNQHHADVITLQELQHG